MTALTMATELQAALVRECDDEEERCKYLSSVLRILANAIDHTSGYEHVMALADQLETDAQWNIDYRDQQAFRRRAA